MKKLDFINSQFYTFHMNLISSSFQCWDGVMPWISTRLFFSYIILFEHDKTLGGAIFTPEAQFKQLVEDLKITYLLVSKYTKWTHVKDIY